MLVALITELGHGGAWKRFLRGDETLETLLGILDEHERNAARAGLTIHRFRFERVPEEDEWHADQE